MESTHTFLLADNQAITRMGLQACIAALFDQSAAIVVGDKKELVAALEQAPDATVILDYTLFDIRGIDELLVLRTRFADASWVLFSNELSEDLIRRMCQLDNVSIALKENSAEEINAALACASRGERYLCHQITSLIAGGFTGNTVAQLLTPAETEILKLIARGLSAKEIAAERFSSTHTIITHKKNIFRKLGVNNVYEATKYALRAGLVEMMEYYI